MLHQVYPRSILSDRGSARRGALRTSAASGWRQLRALLALWRARSRQRQHLREIAEWDAYVLKDIGVSRDAARHEAAKFFWQE